ncbi:uncharacterized protein PSFLO_06833 [Pseudozyma flocculosa]|uniref:Uncharacterized protein n=1 Tax=Pseudozyma flocculosa TaxID=84751 RepID=A0A5C3FD07_9BASI|nr:uncharacterized protein PSFLO_06833 [Pseudozyma flocculosa]
MVAARLGGPATGLVSTSDDLLRQEKRGGQRVHSTGRVSSSGRCRAPPPRTARRERYRPRRPVGHVPPAMADRAKTASARGGRQASLEPRPDQAGLGAFLRAQAQSGGQSGGRDGARRKVPNLGPARSDVGRPSAVPSHALLKRSHMYGGEVRLAAWRGEAGASKGSGGMSGVHHDQAMVPYRMAARRTSQALVGWMSVCNGACELRPPGKEAHTRRSMATARAAKKLSWLVLVLGCRSAAKSKSWLCRSVEARPASWRRRAHHPPASVAVEGGVQDGMPRRLGTAARRHGGRGASDPAAAASASAARRASRAGDAASDPIKEKGRRVGSDQRRLGGDGCEVALRIRCRDNALEGCTQDCEAALSSPCREWR